MSLEWGDVAAWSGLGLGLYSVFALHFSEKSNRRYAALTSLSAQLRSLESTAISYFMSPEDASAKEKSATILAMIRDIGIELNTCAGLLEIDTSDDWMKLRQAVTLKDFQSANRPVFEPTSNRIREIEARASTLIALVLLKLRKHYPI